MIERKTPSIVVRIRQVDYEIVNKFAQSEDRSITRTMSKIITEWAKLQTSNTVVNNNDTQI